MLKRPKEPGKLNCRHF